MTSPRRAFAYDTGVLGRLACLGWLTAVAACGFAALLYKVVTSGAVSSALNALVTRALRAV